MINIELNQDLINIINVKEIGNVQDVKLIKSTCNFSLPKDYERFLNECQYVHMSKSSVELVIYDPISVIHENSIDILSNMKETLDFLCIGKYVNQNKYLLYKNGKEGFGIYDNKDYSKKKLSSNFIDFFNK